ncbi:PP2C family serine/threonine-protein phosphatase [Persicimonas caeni]|nr:SpoIIE family protein phosphatase [Persicimonas caeni]
MELDDGLLFVIADGAGGVGGGRTAAEHFIAAVPTWAGERPDDLLDPWTWCECLSNIDRDLYRTQNAGESTAVIIYVRDGLLAGASVGDSGAWLADGHGAPIELTAAQVRTPRLGTGQCSPTPIGPLPARGQLLLGTDGLFEYLGHDELVDALEDENIERSADALLEAVQLANEAFHDDVALIRGRLS